MDEDKILKGKSRISRDNYKRPKYLPRARKINTKEFVENDEIKFKAPSEIDESNNSKSTKTKKVRFNRTINDLPSASYEEQERNKLNFSDKLIAKQNEYLNVSKMDLNIISHLSIGILSSDDIINMSVMEVKDSSSDKKSHNGINSLKMGAVDNGDICDYCGKDSTTCPRHYGRIEFKNQSGSYFYIPNPNYMPHIIKILSIICLDCFEIKSSEENINLLSIDKIPTQNRLGYLYDRFANNKCTCKKSNQSVIYNYHSTQSKDTGEIWYSRKGDKQGGLTRRSALEVYNIFSKLSNNTIKLMGFSPEYSHPKNLIMRNMLVIPPGSRPNNPVISNSPSEITNKYVKIINIINGSTSTGSDGPTNLYIEIKDLFTIIKKMISSKEGILRFSVLTKRANLTARTVITPDPSLKFGQVSIPESWAPSATIEEMVNWFNIKELTKMMYDGKVSAIIRGILTFRVGFGKKPNLKIGDKVLRHIRDGDIIITGRQPTLWERGIKGLEVVLKRQNTIGLLLAYTKDLNADFDGDESWVHFVQSIESRAEVRTIMDVRNNVISAADSKFSNDVTYDDSTGIRLMTDNNSIVNYSTWYDCAELLTNRDSYHSLDSRLNFAYSDITYKSRINNLIARLSREYNISKEIAEIIFNIVKYQKGNNINEKYKNYLKDKYSNYRELLNRNVDFEESNELVKLREVIFDEIDNLIQNIKSPEFKYVDDSIEQQIKNLYPSTEEIFDKLLNLDTVNDINNIVTNGVYDNIRDAMYNVYYSDIVFHLKQLGINVERFLKTESNEEKISFLQSKSRTKREAVELLKSSLMEFEEPIKLLNLIPEDKWQPVLNKIKLYKEGIKNNDLNILKIDSIKSIINKINEFPSIIFDFKKRPGRDLYSMVLPAGFNLDIFSKLGKRENMVIIRNGILISGIITKSESNKVAFEIFRQFGPKRTSEYITDLSFVTGRWMMDQGFSISYDDCKIDKTNFNRMMKEERRNLDIEISSMVIDSKNSAMKDKINKIIESRTSTMRNKGEDIVVSAMGPNNPLNIMASAGKGTSHNAVQMAGALFQQYYEGEKIGNHLTNGTRSIPYFEPGNDSLEDHGFIVNSFTEGLTPAETFFTEIAGREGMINIATSVSKYGYLNKLFNVAGEDMRTQLGMMTNTTGNIYQFVYGYDSLDPTELTYIDYKGDRIPFPIDIKLEITKINVKFVSLLSNDNLNNNNYELTKNDIENFVVLNYPFDDDLSEEDMIEKINKILGKFPISLNNKYVTLIDKINRSDLKIETKYLLSYFIKNKVLLTDDSIMVLIEDKESLRLKMSSRDLVNSVPEYSGYKNDRRLKTILDELKNIKYIASNMVRVNETWNGVPLYKLKNDELPELKNKIGDLFNLLRFSQKDGMPVIQNKNNIDNILKSVPRARGVFDENRNLIRKRFQKIIKSILKKTPMIEEGIGHLKNVISNKFNNSFIGDGYPVGSIASSSVSQPIQQSAISSFHNAGKKMDIGSAAEYAEHIFKATKINKFDVTYLHFLNRNMTYDEVYDMVSEIVHVKIEDLIKNYNISKFSNFIDDSFWYSNFMEIYGYGIGENDIVLRMELDVDLLYKHKITTGEIRRTINNGFSKKEISVKIVNSPTNIGIIDIMITGSRKPFENLEDDDNIIYSLFNEVKKDIFDLDIKGIKNIKDLTPESVDIIRFIKSEKKINELNNIWKIKPDIIIRTNGGVDFDNLCRLLKLCDIATVDEKYNEITNYDDLRQLEFIWVRSINKPSEIIKDRISSAEKRYNEDKNRNLLLEDKSFKLVEPEILSASKYIYAICKGSNLRKLYYRSDIDTHLTISNNFHEIIDIFDIEVTRNIIIKQITNIVSGIDPRHSMVFVDIMTNRGTISPITAIGASKQQKGSLTKASMGNTFNVLVNASTAGEIEKVKSVSTGVMLAQAVLNGTGYPMDILYETDKGPLSINDYIDSIKITSKDIESSISSIEEELGNIDSLNLGDLDISNFIEKEKELEMHDDKYNLEEENIPQPYINSPLMLIVTNDEVDQIPVYEDIENLTISDEPNIIPFKTNYYYFSIDPRDENLGIPDFLKQVIKAQKLVKLPTGSGEYEIPLPDLDEFIDNYDEMSDIISTQIDK